ncbi:hypothetical protein N748_12255 [Legionella pneumophila str. 121004]|nr:hypothetical protein N748_12255 [Legionella pneumophila str. 121004]ERH44853.1 hypothetical protein N751_12905 [Legionella pneumophila str. Leg01/11]ERH45482.1 hypothetical protein N750_01405 [Legionella pneumophila str. Leg01/53]ERI47187.1 hypothetical protein N749_02900 [Legionella pneumophila str. Leg01/20]
MRIIMLQLPLGLVPRAQSLFGGSCFLDMHYFY